MVHLQPRRIFLDTTNFVDYSVRECVPYLKLMPNTRIAIDLFCGCGGISAGLRNAGFTITAGVDSDPHYLQTFRHNFPEALALEADLSSTSPTDLMRLLRLTPGKLDLLAGGPPCQGFSKNVPRRQRSHDLENNRLIYTFLDYCRSLRPRIILLENVAEMKNGFDQAYSQQISDKLSQLNYTVTHTVLNSANHGVPQRRRRAFFLPLQTAQTSRLLLPLTRFLNLTPTFPTSLSPVTMYLSGMQSAIYPAFRTARA